MTEGGADKQAAGTYRYFMDHPEWPTAMTVESGINSGRAGIDHSDILAKTPWYQAFLDSLDSVVPTLAPGWGKIDAQRRKVATPRARSWPPRPRRRRRPCCCS